MGRNSLRRVLWIDEKRKVVKGEDGRAVVVRVITLILCVLMKE